MLAKKIKLSEPGPIDSYLGCKHDEKSKKAADGTTARYIEYNMEEFLESCIKRYEELCASPVKWKNTDTPFLEESGEQDPFRDPVCKGPGLQCPYCDGVFPTESFNKILT